MDFIEGITKVGGKSVILTVVNRFLKYSHFTPLAHPYSTEIVAQVFFGEIVCLHGIPDSIISDGQYEVVNKVITMYLRCLIGDQARQWVHWLAWAQYIYNTSYHSALRETLFRVVYG